MPKIYIVLLLVIFLTGGCAGQTARTTILSSENAIRQALKEHPDFPVQSGGVKTVRVPTGGPAGAAAMVDYETLAEKTPDGNYLITLTKDWHLTVNGQKVFSYWKYQVSPDDVTLLESEDKDFLPNLMK